MDEQRRILYRALAVVAGVAVCTAAVAIWILYRASFAEEERLLAQIASTRAGMIRALAGSDGRDVLRALTEPRDAGHLAAFGQSGELLVARREGDRIVFAPGRPSGGDAGAAIPWQSQGAEPMRRALSGQSGTTLFRDEDGSRTLAAYEALPDLGLGVVAQVEVAALQAPFLRAAVVSCGAALLLVAAGAVCVLRLVRRPLQRIGERSDLQLEAETHEREDAQERNRAILDTAVDSIVTIDERGTIEAINRAGLENFGYDEDELLGCNVSTLMPDPHDRQHDGYLQRYLETGVPRIIGVGREVPCRRKDGSTFPGDLAVSEVRLRGRRCFTGILRDLSERKAAEGELREAEQRARAAEELASVGTLVAGLAHEIGTPMGVIQGHAKLLERAVEGERAMWRLQTIQEQIGRISKIIQSLLDMARPKAAERVPIELEALLETTLSFLSENLRRRGVRIVRDFEATPNVPGDPERLQQLLLNLFLNAIDAMPEGGELGVGLRSEGTGAVLRVTDTGVGIAPGDLHRIFEAFYTSKEAGKGNGLGLMVASRIVSDHGGRIEVHSTPGEGTEFEVYLPGSAPPAGAS